MKKINFVFVLVVAFALFVCTSGVVSATIYVPDDYAKIQWAVKNATAGDTIIVREESYTENVDVDKRLTIKSENGSANCIVQAGNPDDHVFEVTADYVNISGFTVENATANWMAGIYLGSNVDNCNITNTNVSNNSYGIRLWDSSNNMITNNNATNNVYGIYLENSSNNTLTNNTANLNTRDGICLASSSNNTLTNNNNVLITYDFSFDGINGIRLDSSNNNILTNNNISVTYDIGLVTISGIRLDASCNNTITENILSNSDYGIYSHFSNNNEIANNTFENNGIAIWGSEPSNFNTHTIEGNTINGKRIYYYKNTGGIIVPGDAGQVILVNCTDMVVENIDASSGSVGIELAYTIHSEISNNNVSNNGGYGVYLYSSSNNNITNNSANSNEAPGICLSSSNNNNILNNTANANAVCGSPGIYLYSSSNNEIRSNNASNNGQGIYLCVSSNNNTVTNNEISNNYISGIGLHFSNNNDIYLNNFINNAVYVHSVGSTYIGSSTCIELPSSTNNDINNAYNLLSAGSTNIWNSTSPITYTYSNSTFTNYMGNYWDDYTGSDADYDGIGDTPYSIDGDSDIYPLMELWENYFKPPEEKIFDTGSPANPYPSIFGTHNGTITPDQTITVSKLYTYPCIGTGGHTEYANIWNATWNATATWEGYAGDWHNITFNETFVLYKGEIYNYTIRTGSYPQIIHESPFNATGGGTITCDNFIDANGKVYNKWIPAIRLE